MIQIFYAIDDFGLVLLIILYHGFHWTFVYIRSLIWIDLNSLFGLASFKLMFWVISHIRHNLSKEVHAYFLSPNS